MKRTEKLPRRGLTINRIASAGIRADRKGYTALTLGIMLSIFFITAMCLMICGVLTANETRAHALTGSQDAFLMDTSCTDADLVETGYFTDEIGHVYVTGQVTGSTVYMGCYDERGAAMLQRTLLSGRMPTGAGEIALEQSVLDKLELTASLGDALTFNITPIDGEEVARTYSLVGILKDQTDHMDLSRVMGGDLCIHWPAILFSAEEPAFETGRTIQHMLLMLVPGTNLNDTLKASERGEGMAEALMNGAYAVMRGDGGIQYWSFFIGYQGVANYLASLVLFALGDGGFVVVFLIALLAGALILATIVGISGAMENTLIRRTETIGMLRCVGATKRQIRRIYGRESWLLALATSPVSIALACGFVYAISRALPDYVQFYAPVWLILPVLLLTVIVVLIASSLPLRRASQVMPMSIVRDTKMLRRQTRIRSHNQYRLPTLIARRQTLFHPTRELGSAFLTALMVLMVGVSVLMGAHMLSNRVDFAQSPSFSILGRHTGQLHSYTSLEQLTAFSSGDTAQLRALPLVDRVTIHRESCINLLVDESTPYFTEPIYSLRDHRLALLDECPEGVAQLYYDRSIRELRAVQEFLGTDRKVINLGLTVLTLDPAELSPFLVEGDIDLKALDEGREVLVLAPTYYYKQSKDGGYIVNTRKGNRTDWDYISENDYFTAGMTLDLVQLWMYDDNDGFYSGSTDYSQVEREDVQVSVGGVLSGMRLSYWDVAIITTEKGAQALGLMNTQLEECRVYLSPLPDEAGEASLETRIRTIARRSDTEMYNHIAINRENQQDMLFAMLVFIAIAAVMFAVAAGMVSGSITRRIRAETRLIGTLRAVGADARTLVKCYAGSLWMSLLLGSALGVLMLFAVNQFINLTSGVERTLAWGMAALCIAVFLAGLTLVCRLLVTMRIREVTRHSIVENIREL